MRLVHTALPVSRSIAYSVPPQSGKYTFSRSTAGVAETSPAVWKTLFTAKRKTLDGTPAKPDVYIRSKACGLESASLTCFEENVTSSTPRRRAVEAKTKRSALSGEFLR